MEPLEIQERHDLSIDIFCQKKTEIIIKQGEIEIKVLKLLAGDHTNITIN